MSLVRVLQITAENTGSLVEGGFIIDTGSFFLRKDTGLNLRLKVYTMMIQGFSKRLGFLRSRGFQGHRDFLGYRGFLGYKDF